MNWNALLEGNGIVAWGVAFLLAVGGTAVVVAAWLQFRNTWRRLPSVLTQRRGLAVKPRPGRPQDRLVVESRNPHQAVQAYRGQNEQPAVAPPAATGSPSAPPSLTSEKLSAYLQRLHRAVDELETAASGAPSPS